MLYNNIYCEKIAEGGTAEVFNYDTDKVIKLYKDPSKSNVAEREYKNSKFLFHIGFETPEPFSVIKIDNRSGIIFERINGKDFVNALLDDPETYAKIMARIIYRFHSFDLSDVDLSEIQTYNDYFMHYYEKNSVLTQYEKDYALNKVLNMPKKMGLCHGDFNPTNFIIKDNGEVMLIDCVSLSIGNPLSDIMKLIHLWKYKVIPDRFPEELRKRFYEKRDKILEYFLDEYLSLSHVSINDINEWFVPTMLIMLSKEIDEKEKCTILNDVRKEVYSQ